MDSDRELLKLAAKAAGLELGEWWDAGPTIEIPWKHGYTNTELWNPLTDDGDALRLAVKLRIDVLFDGKDSPNAHVETVANEPGLEAQPWAHEPMRFDENAATRRAIVRAAAELGREPGGRNG